jgi:hypothetical protein
MPGKLEWPCEEVYGGPASLENRSKAVVLPVADGFGKTDGSDGTSSKTTSTRAYKGVFEEKPSGPVSHQAFTVRE